MSLKLGTGSYQHDSCRVLYFRQLPPDQSVVHVGKYCSLAEECEFFIDGYHRMDQASTFPFFELGYTTDPKNKNGYGKGAPTVGHDVWIGRGATILSGVHLGHGCVVGARAVVTKNVPPYAIVAGNPARVVKYRFSPDLCQELLESQWWDLPHDVIVHSLAPYQSDVQEFLRQVKRYRSQTPSSLSPSIVSSSFASLAWIGSQVMDRVRQVQTWIAFWNPSDADTHSSIQPLPICSLTFSVLGSFFQNVYFLWHTVHHGTSPWLSSVIDSINSSTILPADDMLKQLFSEDNKDRVDRFFRGAILLWRRFHIIRLPEKGETGETNDVERYVQQAYKTHEKMLTLLDQLYEGYLRFFLANPPVGQQQQQPLIDETKGIFQNIVTLVKKEYIDHQLSTVVATLSSWISPPWQVFLTKYFVPNSSVPNPYLSWWEQYTQWIQNSIIPLLNKTNQCFSSSSHKGTTGPDPEWANLVSSWKEQVTIVHQYLQRVWNTLDTPETVDSSFTLVNVFLRTVEWGITPIVLTQLPSEIQAVVLRMVFHVLIKPLQLLLWTIKFLVFGYLTQSAYRAWKNPSLKEIPPSKLWTSSIAYHRLRSHSSPWTFVFRPVAQAWMCATFPIPFFIIHLICNASISSSSFSSFLSNMSNIKFWGTLVLFCVLTTCSGLWMYFILDQNQWFDRIVVKMTQQDVQHHTPRTYTKLGLQGVMLVFTFIMLLLYVTLFSSETFPSWFSFLTLMSHVCLFLSIVGPPALICALRASLLYSSRSSSSSGPSIGRILFYIVMYGLTNFVDCLILTAMAAFLNVVEESYVLAQWFMDAPNTLGTHLSSNFKPRRSTSSIPLYERLRPFFGCVYGPFTLVMGLCLSWWILQSLYNLSSLSDTWFFAVSLGVLACFLGFLGVLVYQCQSRTVLFQEKEP